MTTAIILAAGEGQRLRPYTLNTPKCLVPFNGQPLIKYQIDVLRESGIKKIAIVTGYEHEQLDIYGDERIRNPKYSETNMVASLMAAREVLESSDEVIIAYGDILYESRIINALRQSTAAIAITVDTGWRNLWEVRMTDPLSDAETLKMDDKSRLIEIGRRPSSYAEIQAQYMGLIRLSKHGSKAVMEQWDSFTEHTLFMGRTASMMYMTDLLEELIGVGASIHAVPVEHGWLEFDTVTDLERYEELLAAGTLSPLFSLPKSAR